jgi:multidrug efflux pump subunit AcrB
VVVLSFGLLPFLGSNFFPSVDSGQIAMHVRVPVGARIEDTAARFDRIGTAIRQIIPADQLGSLTDNIGLPVSSINTVYNNSGTIGPQDGDILIALKEGHEPTDRVVSRLRSELARRFPGTTFAFLPADITSQILNFGAPAPIDVQVTGRNVQASRVYAQKLLARMKLIPGLADARIQQPANAPQLNVDVSRARIGQYGLTERDVTNSLAASLAGTSQTAPVFFVNPENGVQYPVVAQAPEYLLDSVSALRTCQSPARPAARSSHSAAWPVFRAGIPFPSFRTITSSPRSTSTARPKDATWARFRVTSRRPSRRWKRSSPRA